MHRFAATLLLFVTATPAAALLDTSAPGPHAVGVATVDAVDVRRERTLRSEIWYPAKTAGRDALPKKKKTYPLIMVAPCGSRLDYEYLAVHLASHGFVVAAVDLRGLTNAACATGQEPAGFDELKYDVSFVCRELHEVDGQLGRYAKQVRGFPTGVVGHSLGSSVGFGAAEIDTFFTTVVGLANWLGDVTPPTPSDPNAEPPAHPFDDLSPTRNWMVQGATGRYERELHAADGRVLRRLLDVPRVPRARDRRQPLRLQRRRSDTHARGARRTAGRRQAHGHAVLPQVPRAPAQVPEAAARLRRRVGRAHPKEQVMSGVAFVTGAGRGIGRAIAFRLARAGLAVGVDGSRRRAHDRRGRRDHRGGRPGDRAARRRDVAARGARRGVGGRGRARAHHRARQQRRLGQDGAVPRERSGALGPPARDQPRRASST